MVDQDQEGDRTFDSSDIKNTLDETKKISATQGETDETLDGIENNEDLMSTTILPKLILRNGHFIESESSSQKLLWVPVSDSSYTSTFFGLFKTISNSFPFSMLYHQRSNGRMMENVQSSPRNDIESQEPPPPLEHSFVNTDGIYKPLNQTRTNHKYQRHNIRSLLRLKRDGIQVNNENNGPQQCIEPKLKWIRPQDVQPSDLASQKENYIDEATARKISKQESDFSYALEVYIERIKFHSHPLIIEEEKLIQNIEVLLSKFRSLNNRAVMRNFEIRLGVIIKEITELKSRHTEQKSVITEILEEQTCLVLYNNFLDLTSKIAELGLETYSLYSTILKKWDNVTRIRKGQGFQSTSQSLVKVSNESSINDESMTEQIQNFPDTLEWFAKTVEGYSKYLESESVAQSLHSAVETLSVIHSAKKFRMDISLNIDDDRTFSLSENVIENRRRDKIRSEVYYAKLLIDGQVVETTSTRALEWTSLDIKLDDIF